MSCSNHFVNHALETSPTTTTPLSRHSGKEKVTPDDLFLLHSMDGGNRLGYGELVNDIPDNDEDEGAADAGNDDEGGVRHRPNMSFTNRLRAMGERLGEIETYISKLGSNVDDLTYVVSGMSEQYDQFYGEFGQMRMEQERYREYDLAHLKLVFEFSIYKVWKSVEYGGNPQMDLQDKEVIDSGCLRHMTGNMSYLTDYEEIDEGYVAFRGNLKGGKMTEKDVWNKNRQSFGEKKN
ncbi:hypothetical protein Tco_0427375 [Tanacetum coccineum]